ncbi:MAG: division/cell wall cluster transcriptional repressor MraZ [Actinomycetota bacterium]|nr:division/cell wall cluster transcriptional repressor MraZ [Actinomycetota bacterium]
MFLGEFEHSLDEKGRLILPSKFRDALSDGVVITVGMEKSLFVIPKTEWPQWEDKIRSLPLAKKDARKFSRFFFAGASEEEITKQGRISIPANLRNYAGLSKVVVIIGVSDRLEIWDKDNWLAYQGEAEESYSDIAEDLLI